MKKEKKLYKDIVELSDQDFTEQDLLSAIKKLSEVRKEGRGMVGGDISNEGVAGVELGQVKILLEKIKNNWEKAIQELSQNKVDNRYRKIFFQKFANMIYSENLENLINHIVRGDVGLQGRKIIFTHKIKNKIPLIENGKKQDIEENMVFFLDDGKIKVRVKIKPLHPENISFEERKEVNRDREFSLSEEL